MGLPENIPSIDEYLAGTRLYGDDLSREEITRWYADEEKDFASLVKRSKAFYAYAYHALNRRCGFRFLRGRRFRNVLGLGSAFGDEFLPIVHQLDQITIIEPSKAFWADDVGGDSLPLAAAFGRWQAAFLARFF